MKAGSVASVVGSMLILIIVLIVGLQMVDRIFRGDKDLNFYRMITIAIGLNLMIFVFLFMTFDKIQFAPGPQGPQGNKGNKGPSGYDKQFNACSKHVETSEDKKFRILRKQNAVAKKPAIVEDEDIVY
jgi:hypothetical protein